MGPLYTSETSRSFRLKRRLPAPMEGNIKPGQPTQNQASAMSYPLKSLVLLLFLPIVTAAASPHQPMNLTWMIISATTGEIVNATSSIQPRNTWWPDLDFDLCLLAAGAWDIGDWQVKQMGKPECGPGVNRCNIRSPTSSSPGCSHPIQRAILRGTPFYICPGGGRDRTQTNRCGGADKFYCNEWGCESTGTVPWDFPVKNDLISVKRIPGSAGLTGGHGRGSTIQGPCLGFLCNPIRLSFTNAGKSFPSWEAGRSWGLRLYQSGYDNGLLFTLMLKVEAIQTGPSQGLGPNLLLAPGERSTPRPRPTD